MKYHIIHVYTLLLLYLSSAAGCELSEFGCCPDGVTKALDNDLQGCPQVRQCDMLPISGPCVHSIRSWYYNAQSQTCQHFIFSGCGGNANRFESKGECWQVCASRTIDKDAVTIKAGANVTLTCPLPDGYEYVSWTLYQNVETYDLDEGEIPAISVMKYGPTRDLFINEIHKGLSGVYTCKVAESTNQIIASIDRQIIVEDSSKDESSADIGHGSTKKTTPSSHVAGGDKSDAVLPVESAATKAVTIGSDVTLTCNVPEGTKFIAWELVQSDQITIIDYGTFDNMEASLKDTKAVLAITHIRSHQAGTYVCELQELFSPLVANAQLDLIVLEPGTAAPGAPATFVTDDSVDPEVPTDDATTLEVTLTPDMESSVLETSSISSVVKETNTQSDVLAAPVNLRVTEEEIRGSAVTLVLTWENPKLNYPVSVYIVKSVTNDISEGRVEERQITTPNRRLVLADLVRPGVFYFTVSAVTVGGQWSAESSRYRYSTEEAVGESRSGLTESNRLLGSCSSTRWGCCPDGSTPASGPYSSGCHGDTKPCDISEYGCCPDGQAKAKGDDFRGCTSTLKERNSICTEAINERVCSPHVVRWYYDGEKGKCSRFWYGGCEMHNVFETEKECVKACDSLFETATSTPEDLPICSQPTVTGPCKGNFYRYAYDPKSASCVGFVYGGCRGNSNRFVSQSECEERCRSADTDDDNQVEDLRPITVDLSDEFAVTNLCTLEKESGNCRERQIKWYYDKSRRFCGRFIYTGCGGNDNRFDDRATCRLACVNQDRTTTTAGITPTIPTTTTLSTTTITIATTHNPNTDLCTLEKESGNCRERQIKWYYDKSRQFCGRFIYTGCGGNDNRFDDRATCRLACVNQDRTTTTAGITPTTPTAIISTLSTPSVDVCSLKKELGLCGDYKIYWYYDTDRQVCHQFYYSGCGGNGNRFSSRQSCMAECQGSHPQTTLPTTTIGGFEEEPRITNHDDTEYRVGLGESLVLRCRSRGYPRPVHIWYKQRKPLQTDSSKYMYNSVSGDLHIYQVDSTDTAEFICKAHNGIGRPDYLYSKVLVTSPVRVLNNDTVLDASPGSTNVLACDTEGLPPPTITWMYNNNPTAIHSVDKSSLVIRDFSESEAGTYRCVADNGFTADERTVQLVLREPLQVSLADHSKIYKEGDSLSLICLTTGSPAANVSWTIDGRQLRTTSRRVAGHALTVSDLVESDSGYYTCTASNGIETVSASTSIRVDRRVTLPPAPKPCGERPELANCALIVQYGYCTHPVYKIYCCKSCLKAGKLATTTTTTPAFGSN